jgi:hypothetical protein
MVYSEFESMGSDETPEISTQCKEASTEQREGSLEGQLREASTEAASPLGAESDPESQSGNSGDNETASDNSGHVKVATMAALAGISYDFGQSNIMKTRIGLMESYTRYFSKGYGQPPRRGVHPGASSERSCHCRGNIPWVPQATDYDPKLWIQSVSSNGKQLGNHTPRTRKWSHHSRLKRRGHQPKKILGTIHAITSPPYD